MSWGNNNYRNGRDYGQNNYGGGQGFGGGNFPPDMVQMMQQFMQNGGRQFKKRSGAKKIVKNDKTYISAWNYSRERGMITAFVFAHDKSHVFKNRQGEESVTLCVKVFYKKTGQELIRPCTMKVSTGKVTIPDLGMTINPNASNGGYFGTFTKRK